jgi:hypothetical protein
VSIRAIRGQLFFLISQIISLQPSGTDFIPNEIKSVSHVIFSIMQEQISNKKAVII